MSIVRAGAPGRPPTWINAPLADKASEGGKASRTSAGRTRRGGERPLVPGASTGERYYSDDEQELILAMRAYQDRTKVRFPTLCEILAIVKQLGYRKVPPA